jgi:hypothetical protein
MMASYSTVDAAQPGLPIYPISSDGCRQCTQHKLVYLLPHYLQWLQHNARSTSLSIYYPITSSGAGIQEMKSK